MNKMSLIVPAILSMSEISAWAPNSDFAYSNRPKVGSKGSKDRRKKRKEQKAARKRGKK